LADLRGKFCSDNIAAKLKATQTFTSWWLTKGHENTPPSPSSPPLLGESPEATIKGGETERGTSHRYPLPLRERARERGFSGQILYLRVRHKSKTGCLKIIV